MPKTRQTLHANVPAYVKDRGTWRRRILRSVLEAKERLGVEYPDDERFEVEVLLYMTRGKGHDVHDVDNRLKDILDALQGRFRGPVHKKLRLIKNDNKICRAVIEKRPTPKRYLNKTDQPGVIRPYRKG